MQSREVWLKQIKESLSARDFRLVEKASGILIKNIAPNTEGVLWNPYRAITPSMRIRENGKPAFPGIWNWDSAFHMIGTARFDKDLAHEQMRAFFLFQKEDGLLPDVIYLPMEGSRILDKYSKPPVWAWALELTDRRQPDDAFLAEMYPKLVKNEHFWRTQRYREEDGLFFYSTSETGKLRATYMRWESGLDDSIRFDGSALEHMYPVDLNCFMIAWYKSMQYLAQRLNRPDDIRIWQQREKALEAAVQRTLWSEADACFWDWDYEEKAFVKVITPAIYMPLWAGIATKAQAAAVERFAKDPKKLYPCMPTVALDHPKMDPLGYWRGSVWMNTAYFAIKGLYDYGLTETAMKIRNTLLNWLEQTDTIFENYNPLTGEGKCAKDFSWSCVFAMEMIFEMPQR